MPTPINISASRGAAILGLSNWTTQIQAWLQIKESREPGFCEKHNYELPVVEYTPAMRWGHAFESAIIEFAERKQGCEIIDREKLFIADIAKYGNNHQKGDSIEILMDILTCHVDGIYDPEVVLHEGKTTSIFYFNDNFGEPGTDQMPIEYQIQCQHQMICTGAEKVILSVLVFPRRVEDWVEMGWIVDIDSVGNYYLNKTGNFIDSTPCRVWAESLNDMGYFHQYEITANKELQDLMIQHYTEFWNKYIIGNETPEPFNYDDIKLLCREPVGSIIADEKIERLIAERKGILKEIGGSGELKKRADRIKVEVLKYMRNNEKTLDDESQKKWILYNREGEKIAMFSGGRFR